ncbi:arf-GAP with Rho-GAP domain, ANK repeat and PH domain-containing protein 1 [Gastrophryne carolinensis]
MSDGLSLPVSEWLQSIKLDQYSDLLEKHELRTLLDARHLTDERLLHMGIHLPGHRKRILASLLKSFPQGPPVEKDGTRPVPKKRTVLPKAQSPTLSLETPPETTKGAPPPIPPRTTRVPPHKFSVSPPKSDSPVSLADSQSTEEPWSPERSNFCPSPFTPDASGFLENDGDQEEAPVRAVAPPLPLKRHKLETRNRSPPPPLPLRPSRVSPALPSSYYLQSVPIDNSVMSQVSRSDVRIILGVGSDVGIILGVGSDVRIVLGVGSDVRIILGVGSDVGIILGVGLDVSIILGVGSDVGIILGVGSDVGNILGVGSDVRITLGVGSDVRIILGVGSDVGIILGVGSDVGNILGVGSDVRIILGVGSDVRIILGVGSDVGIILGVGLDGRIILGVGSDVRNILGVGSDVRIILGVGSDVRIILGVGSDVGIILGVGLDVRIILGVGSDVRIILGVGSDVGIILGVGLDGRIILGVWSDVGIILGVGSGVRIILGVGSDVGIILGVGSHVRIILGVGSDVGNILGVGSDVRIILGVGSDVGIILGVGSDVRIILGEGSDFTIILGVWSDVGIILGVGSGVRIILGVGSDVGIILGLGSDVSFILDVGSDVGIILDVGSDIRIILCIGSYVTFILDVGCKNNIRSGTDIGITLGVGSDVRIILGVGSDVRMILGVGSDVGIILGVGSDVRIILGVGSDVGIILGVGSDVEIMLGVGSDVGIILGVGSNVMIILDVGSDIRIILGVGPDVRIILGAGSDVGILLGVGSDVRIILGFGSDVRIILGVGSDVRIILSFGSDVGIILGAGSDVGIILGFGSDVRIILGFGSDVGIILGVGSDVEIILDVGSDVRIILGAGSDVRIILSVGSDVTFILGVRIIIGVRSDVGIILGVWSDVRIILGLGSDVRIKLGVGSVVGIRLGVGSDVGITLGVGSDVLITLGVGSDVRIILGQGQMDYIRSDVGIILGVGSDIEIILGVGSDVRIILGVGSDVGITLGVGSDVRIILGVGSDVRIILGVGSDVGITLGVGSDEGITLGIGSDVEISLGFGSDVGITLGIGSDIEIILGVGSDVRIILVVGSDVGITLGVGPSPAPEEAKSTEDQLKFSFSAIPKPLPRVFPRDPPAPPAPPPPLRDVFAGLQKPEVMESDSGNIYEFHKDIDKVALLSLQRLNVANAALEDDAMDNSGDEYDDARSIIQSDSDLSTWRSSSSLSSGISSSHSFGGNMEDGELSAQQSAPVIKAGWLDKNPPQGSYIFQRRWVKLDADYLRYYDSDKDMYSKRMIRTSAIAKVSSMGDQKFEVTTSNRNFMFRAESDAERNDWMKVVQQILDERKTKAPASSAPSPENADKYGLLEMRGCKPKLFVVVAADKVFLYKNGEDFVSGVGITSIDMNVGNVKEVDKRSFDLTTPYKTFSFIADGEQERADWVEAMMQSVAEALSNFEVAKKIWSAEGNRRCADCQAPNPDWASVNLCVVICKKCAGEHRSLGPHISKVRSLKMDNKIWTDELIQLFLKLGNEAGNKFWAANVPPSEAINAGSAALERRTFIIAKYREGKYRRYHQLFGNQLELNKALCIAVTTGDLTETQALLFCGADINYSSGEDFFSQPLELAQQHGQKLQEEFLRQNRTSETPRLEVGMAQYYVTHHSVTHNGYLYKTSSMAKAVTDRKAKEEFSRRWCVLNEGVLSYYENNHSNSPNGEIRVDEIVCVAVIPPDTHGYDSTFEIYTKSERLYLFAAEKPEEAREWVKSLTKCFLPVKAEELLSYDFDRIGKLQFKDGRNLERLLVGWFSLCNTNLYMYVEESDAVEVIDLRKLSELSTKDKDLVLVEKGRITYIQGERKLDFSGWVSAIQKASGTSGGTLSEQQLTSSDVPCIVHKCIDHISRFGVGSEGIYRKSGQKSKITNLLEALKKDARSVVLTEDEPVDNVSDTLKRFFREIGEGVFAKHCRQWLHVTGMESAEERIRHYQTLLEILPPVNRATLKALISHLHCIQHFSDINQMNTHNLAIVFGTTLFQTDGQTYTPGQVVEDLITYYLQIFNVESGELQKQLDLASTIMKVRNEKPAIKGRGTDFICSVYLKEKRPECEQSVHIAVTMTAQELTATLLEWRDIRLEAGQYWSCFEVDDSGEIERPLHFSEKVLHIFLSQATNNSHLVVKEDLNMDAMLFYIKNRVGDSKTGMMAFREDKSLFSKMGFHDRYFMLNGATLRMYKEIRSHRPEKEWSLKNLTIYLGVKKKIHAPSNWGFTIISKNEKNEKNTWYLCCDKVGDMREWLAAFMFVQYGSLWPEDSTPVRTRRSQLDASFANRSLIPIRGTEADIRRSIASFTTDPQTVSNFNERSTNSDWGPPAELALGARPTFKCKYHWLIFRAHTHKHYAGLYMGCHI